MTGRRRSEVIDLKAKDISVEGERSFYFYRGKGEKLAGANSHSRPLTPCAVSQFFDHSSQAVTTVYLRLLEGQTDDSWGMVAQAIGIA